MGTCLITTINSAMPLSTDALLRSSGALSVKLRRPPHAADPNAG